MCFPGPLAGENVVMIANHQSEADPAVFALLLEKAFPRLAERELRCVRLPGGGCSLPHMPAPSVRLPRNTQLQK